MPKQPSAASPFEVLLKNRRSLPEQEGAAEVVAASSPAPRGKPAARSNKPGYQKLTVYLPADLYRRLKILAASEDLELYQIAEEALELWLRQRSV